MSQSDRGLLGNLLGEIVRRRVHRVAMGYVAFGWMFLEATDLIAPLLGLPGWTVYLVLTLVTLGFPVAIVLSWIYDLTPNGIVQVDYSAKPVRIIQFVPLLIIWVLLAVIAYLLVRDNQAEVPVTNQPASIAVLAFKNFSGDVNNEYFSDGVSEEILNSLANVEGLLVASRTSSFFFKGNSDVTEIAGKLGVATVLEGSVRKDGDTVRITAQLIDGVTGYHIWSQNYDVQMNNILRIHDEIARQVVSAIKPVLLPNLAPAVERIVDPESYNHFLKGQNYLHQPFNAEILTKAESEFQQSIAKDATFARAYSGLCEVYLRRYSRSKDVSQFQQAEQSCNRAITRSSNEKESWEIYLALGELYRKAGEYAKSLDAIDHAFSLHSATPRLYIERGMTLSKQEGRSSQAESSFLAAQDLNPKNWDSYLSLGNFYYSQQCFEAAIDQYNQALEIVPGYASALIGLGSSYYMSGNHVLAEEKWLQAEVGETLPADLGSLGVAYSNLGLKYYYDGNFEKAVSLQQKAIELRPLDHRLWGRLAESYRGAADPENEHSAYVRAIELAEEEVRVNPGDWETLGLLGLYYAHSQQPANAHEQLDAMLTNASQNSTAYYFASLISIALGETGFGFGYLEQAAELGLSSHFISNDPDLVILASADSLRFASLADREQVDITPVGCSLD